MTIKTYNGGKQWTSEILWGDIIKIDPKKIGNKIATRFNQILKEKKIAATWDLNTGIVKYEGDIEPFDFEDLREQAMLEILAGG